MVNIVYTPYFSFSSKWVFTLGLLAHMCLDDLVSIHLYCDCQAQRCNFWSSHRSHVFFVVVITILCLIYTKNQLELRQKRKRTKEIDQTDMSIYANECYNQYSIVRWHYHSFILIRRWTLNTKKIRNCFWRHSVHSVEICFDRKNLENSNVFLMTSMVCTKYQKNIFNQFIHLLTQAAKVWDISKKNNWHMSI